MATLVPGSMLASSASPQSSGEDDDEPVAQAGGDFPLQTSQSSGSQPPRVGPAMQKRRRVTRACDECRRKKIKCDGKQPCTHCTVYSYDCTYDQPSNRRRNPAPQYIEALESRLQRAEAVLRTVLPDVDLSDPNIDTLIKQRRQMSKGKDIPASDLAVKVEDDMENDSQLRSMIESTGTLDLDERGNWDFHGGSSGTVFMRRMREQFGSILGDHGAPVLPRIPRPNMAPLYDSPRSSTQSPYDNGLPNTLDLPPRETAKALCEAALSSACSLLRFMHHPTFYEMFDKIYDNPLETFGDIENRYLILLYAVLALGSMFHIEPNEDPSGPVQNTYKAGIDQGLRYFRVCRSMMDITDCRDVVLLQAILFMILFLQSSANLSTCYSYIGIALRSAMRLGLHRNLIGNFNPIELETRKRVFWVIRKMDTYVSALLGFPQMLSDDDIDQELPIEVDDEFITKTTILPMPPGKPSLRFAAANAHTRLMFTLAKVIKFIYPLKGLEFPGGTKSYTISHVKIREIERDLTQWLEMLPLALRPSGDGDPEVLRAQQLLRLSYAHCQMMLYRPFLHYVSRKAGVGKMIDDRSFACAAACVSVSRNIVHITAEMKRRGLLVGAYWFTMYTTFFAIISLVYFVLENPDEFGSDEILLDANAGFDALKGLAHRSQAADRCSMALKNLFEHLPERLRSGRPNAHLVSKKRSAPSPGPPTTEGAGGLLDQPLQDSELGLLSKRAATFPIAPSSQRLNLQRDGHRLHRLSNPNLQQSFPSLQHSSTTAFSDPINANPSVQEEFQSLPAQARMNEAVPHLGTMMFSSADPFAYPNQSNTQAQSHVPGLYLANSNIVGGQIYDNLEGQLFGPLPPYLSQGQSHYDFQISMPEGGVVAPDTGYAGMMPNDEMTMGNFDIFEADGNGWGDVLGTTTASSNSGF